MSLQSQSSSGMWSVSIHALERVFSGHVSASLWSLQRSSRLVMQIVSRVLLGGKPSTLPDRVSRCATSNLLRSACRLLSDVAARPCPEGDETHLKLHVSHYLPDDCNSSSCPLTAALLPPMLRGSSVYQQQNSTPPRVPIWTPWAAVDSGTYPSLEPPSGFFLRTFRCYLLSLLCASQRASHWLLFLVSSSSPCEFFLSQRYSRVSPLAELFTRRSALLVAEQATVVFAGEKSLGLTSRRSNPGHTHATSEAALPPQPSGVREVSEAVVAGRNDIANLCEWDTCCCCLATSLFPSDSPAFWRGSEDNNTRTACRFMTLRPSLLPTSATTTTTAYISPRST